MNYEKTIVCVANSTKHLGRCVAGLELVNGVPTGWVRPVSDRPGREISEEDRRFESGQTCSVLDIVKIPFDRPEPLLHQRENHVIDGDYYWEKVGELPAAQLIASVQQHNQPMWPFCQSTNYGHNDKIPQALLPQIGSSLTLIQPAHADIVVSTDPGFNGAPGKVAVRANFSCGGQRNSLKITDPLVKADYMGRGHGTYRLNNPLMCISLAEPWAEQPYAFKVVASLFLP